jgi:hypothetical protein
MAINLVLNIDHPAMTADDAVKLRDVLVYTLKHEVASIVGRTALERPNANHVVFLPTRLLDLDIEAAVV